MEGKDVLEEKNVWKIYKDKLGDKDLIVRVDTSAAKEKYKHTFYVAVPYKYSRDKSLPSKNELEKVRVIENIIEEKIISQRKKIVFVGCATFGGFAYLTYVSNERINWQLFVNIDEIDLLIGEYENDNMGYYNKILYPRYLR